MAKNDSMRTEQTGEIVAGGIALATLILADNVTVLHFLFGLPLFLYLIQDFYRPTSFSNRLILSLEISFATLLLTSWPLDLILSDGKAQLWVTILAIQCIVVSLFVWALKAEFKHRTARGKV